MAITNVKKYKDQRLTKKVKPVNQGGGPNYLGKQETVTVPKKWLSDPDHVVAELAYITPREQKILLDANIYGSLKGKPNKGPGGIMSLQGDLGGYDASPGGPDSGGPGGPRVGELDKNKQRAKDIMTGKINVSSPTGITEGYKGPAPIGQNKFGDFVGPGYKGKIGGFDDQGIFSTSLAPTPTKSKKFSFVRDVLFPAGLTLINPALGAKYSKAKMAYNTVKTLSNVAQTFGLTDTNVVDSFVNSLTNRTTKTSKDKIKDTRNLDDNKDRDGIGSTPEMAALRDEYYFLLQKLQAGNILSGERNRLTALKNLLGIG